MRNPYYLLFFSIYDWNKRNLKKSDQPVLNSMLAISLLMFVNLVTISLLFQMIFGINIISFDNMGPIRVIVIITLIILFNVLLLLYKNRYRSIISKYNFKSISGVEKTLTLA